jgi:hypothetical protein
LASQAVEKAEAKALALSSTPSLNSIGSVETLLTSLNKSPKKAFSSSDSFGMVILDTSTLEGLMRILPSRGM